MSDRSTPPEYFDRLYASNPDPWRFASDSYEQAKYAATVAMLPRPRFRTAFEVGCSIGILTSLLAARCDRVLGVDVSEAALRLAAAHCAGTGHVAFARMRVPEEWPAQTFDLIVLSEVLYFLSHRDLRRTADNALRSLDPDGVVVLVNWLGETGSAQGGDEAATRFIDATAPSLRVAARSRAPRYRIDVLVR